jgi:sugar phosphate isomerase/epimerase
MRLGICTSYKAGNALLAAKPDYIEEIVQELLDPLGPEEAFARRLEQVAGGPFPVLAVNRFVPGTLKSVGPELDQPALLSYAATAFRRARAMNLSYIVYGSGDSRRIPEGFSRTLAAEQFVRLLAAMAPMAAASGVTLLVEPLSRPYCNFVSSLAEGAEIVQAVGHPSVWLMADYCHMLREGERATEIVRFGSSIRHCHVAERDHSAPGTTGEDFGPFLEALRDISFEGGVTLECAWNDLATESAMGLATIRREAMQVGLHAPSSADGRGQR